MGTRRNIVTLAVIWLFAFSLPAAASPLRAHDVFVFEKHTNNYYLSQAVDWHPRGAGDNSQIWPQLKFGYHFDNLKTLFLYTNGNELRIGGQKNLGKLWGLHFLGSLELMAALDRLQTALGFATQTKVFNLFPTLSIKLERVSLELIDDNQRFYNSIPGPNFYQSSLHFSVPFHMWNAFYLAAEVSYFPTFGKTDLKSPILMSFSWSTLW